MSGPIQSPPPGRKRHTLREMANYAFDEACKITECNSRRAEAGVVNYPQCNDMKKAAILEDICHFLDAVMALDGAVKKEIVTQIAETQRRKAGIT